MKNTPCLWTMSGVLIALSFGSVAFGADLTPKQKPKDWQPDPLHVAPQPPTNETKAILGQAPNQAPQPQDYLLHIAQNTAAPQAVVLSDPYVQAELDRLAADVAALKKDTKKPDTKKAWSAPRVSGRLFLDSVNVMGQNAAATEEYGGNIQNATGFRELRIGVSGSGYDAFDYKIELGFQGSTVVLIDNWIGAKNLPLLGYVRAGHFKPETGLYYPMSSNDISLMEYTTSANVFGLSRRIGISSENTFANDRVRAFFGVFQSGATDVNRVLREDNQGQIVNLRLSMAPYFAQEGKHLLHLGGHWEYVATDALSGKKAAIDAKPAALSLYSPVTLNTGQPFDCDHYNRGGLEFALQSGPFSVRSEAFAGSYAAYKDSPSRNLYGAYVELGWFLTGEYRSYDLKKAGFGGVKPKKNFRPFKSGDYNLIDGLGAWQAVFQWSYVDMSDWRHINRPLAGYQNDLIFGLSWFWTPQLRWVFEYVHSMQCVGPAGNHRHPTEDIFGTSIRVNF